MSTDTFTRSTSYGLGTDGTFTYVWTDRDTHYSVASDSLFYVDGSQVVLPAGGSDWDSYVVTAPALATSGSASFDVYFPALSSGEFLQGLFLHLMWPGNAVALPIGFEHDYDYDHTDPHILFGPYTGSFSSNSDGDPVGGSVAIEDGNWYTAKIVFEADDHRAGYKLWKRSDPEPTDFLFVLETDTTHGNSEGPYGDGYDDLPWLEFYYTATSESYLDNLVFSSTPETIPRARLAKAIITNNTVREWLDDFSRTTTFGLGASSPAYTFITNDGNAFSTVASNYSTESSDPVHVDGSQIVSPETATRTRSAYRLPGVRSRNGWLSVDFRVPTDGWLGHPTPNSDLPRLRIYLGASRTYDIGLGVEPSGTNSASIFGVTPANTYDSVFLSLTQGSWYTAKLFYDDDNGIGQVLIKAQGAADTAALGITSEFALFVNNNSYPFKTGDDRIVITVPNTGTGNRDVLIDNIRWLGPVGFTADALILRSILTANAVVRRAQTGSFTADATILSIRTVVARAVIRASRSATFTASASISLHFFRANAFITDLGLLRHYWDRDHRGSIVDSLVVLDEPIDVYPVGETLHRVLSALWNRST